MPRVRKPLLARLGKALKQGAESYTDYRQGQKLRDVFGRSDNATLSQLGDMVDPITGELSATGKLLLQGEFANQRAQTQSDALLDRIDYQDSLRRKREEEEEFKEILGGMLSPQAAKYDKKAGEYRMFPTSPGILMQAGIDESTVSPSDLPRLARYLQKKGTLPEFRTTPATKKKVGGFIGLPIFRKDEEVPGKTIFFDQITGEGPSNYIEQELQF
jgi:hypothetical protein